MSYNNRIRKDCRIEQNRTEQNKIEQNRIEQNRVEQNRREEKRIEQNNIQQNRIGQDRIGLGEEEGQQIGKENEIQKEKEIMHGNIEMPDYYGVVRNFANEPNSSSER